MHPFRIVLAFPLLLVSQLAHAGYSPNGYITNIRVMYDGVVSFDAESKVSPPCQSSANPKAWAFDSNSTSGQSKLAVLLSAYSLHRRIFVGGTSLCSSRGDLEEPDFINITEN